MLGKKKKQIVGDTRRKGHTWKLNGIEVLILIIVLYWKIYLHQKFFLSFPGVKRNPFFITKCLQVSTFWQNWPCGNSDNNYSGSDRDIKDTLMQIWKSPYIFGSIEKSYPENFPFSILMNLELFTRAVCVFLKNWANF